MIIIYHIIQEVSKKVRSMIFRKKLGHIFQNIFKLQPITTLFQKEISIVNHTAHHLRKTACPKKQQNCFFLLKTVWRVDQTLQFWVSRSKKYIISYGQNSQISFPWNWILKNLFFLHIPDWYKQFCKYWWVCNFFAIWLRMLILFLNDVGRGYRL